MKVRIMFYERTTQELEADFWNINIDGSIQISKEMSDGRFYQKVFAAKIWESIEDVFET